MVTILEKGKKKRGKKKAARLCRRLGRLGELIGVVSEV